MQFKKKHRIAVIIFIVVGCSMTSAKTEKAVKGNLALKDKVTEIEKKIELLKSNHDDYFSIKTLRDLSKESTTIVTVKDCHKELTKASTGFRILTLSPGDKANVDDIAIEAVPTYNLESSDYRKNVSKSLKAGNLYSTDNIIGNMRYVPATGLGGFTEGSPRTEPGHHREAQFTHILTKNIAVMETEVTRKMWADLKALQPALPPDPTNIDRGSGMNNPVNNVSWYQAILFANLLSQQNGLTRCYYSDVSFTTPINSSSPGTVFCDFSANGYRLPTEGEWEFFARAGTTGPFSINELNYNSTTYYSGTPKDLPNLSKVAVFSAMENGKSWPVASLKANPWNLYDVHGNVWEWCWDKYDNYPEGTRTDYRGPSVPSIGDVGRAKRSGGWTMIGAKWVRSAARGHCGPGSSTIDCGFRLVRTL